MKFLEKLQNKPEREKKMILWIILVIVGAIFIGLWLYICSKNFNELKNSNVLEQINLEQINFPEENE